jgi:hypothetical protein
MGPAWAAAQGRAAFPSRPKGPPPARLLHRRAIPRYAGWLIAQGGPVMIRHIVFFRARNREDVGRVLDGLSILKTIPHSSRLEVTLNGKVDQLGNDVDVVVYGEFADAAALAAYKAHPTYQASIDRVRPLRDLRMAADYEVVAG